MAHIVDILLLKRTSSEIEIDCLKRRLVEAKLKVDADEKAIELSTFVKSNEMEANLVIKQLQEKVWLFIYFLL